MFSNVRNNSKCILQTASFSLASSLIVSPEKKNMKYISTHKKFNVEINGLHFELMVNHANNKRPEGETMSKEVNIASLIANMTNNYLESTNATEGEKEFVSECRKILNDAGGDIHIELTSIEYNKKYNSGKVFQTVNIIPIAGIAGAIGGTYAGSAVGRLIGTTTGTIFGILGGINGGLVGCAAVIPFLMYMKAKNFIHNNK